MQHQRGPRLPNHVENTHLSFFLQVECVDLLELSLELEEERALICLERGLGILNRLSGDSRLLGVDDWSGAESFDELGTCQSMARHTSSRAYPTFLSAL